MWKKNIDYCGKPNMDRNIGMVLPFCLGLGSWVAPWQEWLF
jgi:hypothetical protein